MGRGKGRVKKRERERDKITVSFTRRSPLQKNFQVVGIVIGGKKGNSTLRNCVVNNLKFHGRI